MARCELVRSQWRVARPEVDLAIGDRLDPAARADRVVIDVGSVVVLLPQGHEREEPGAARPVQRRLAARCRRGARERSDGKRQPDEAGNDEVLRLHSCIPPSWNEGTSAGCTDPLSSGATGGFRLGNGMVNARGSLL